MVMQVKVEDIDAYAPKDLVIVTTGSQVRYSTADTQLSINERSNH